MFRSVSLVYRRRTGTSFSLDYFSWIVEVPLFSGRLDYCFCTTYSLSNSTTESPLSLNVKGFSPYFPGRREPFPLRSQNYCKSSEGSTRDGPSTSRLRCPTHSSLLSGVFRFYYCLTQMTRSPSRPGSFCVVSGDRSEEFQSRREVTDRISCVGQPFVPRTSSESGTLRGKGATKCASRVERKRTHTE